MGMALPFSSQNCPVMINRAHNISHEDARNSSRPVIVTDKITAIQ